MRKIPTNIDSAARKISLTLILSAVIFFSVQAFILNPLYVYTSTNVLFSTTPLPEIIGILNDISYPLGYALCFACVTYSIFKFSLSRAKKPIIILSAAFLLRYVANYVISSIIEGGFRFSEIPAAVILPFGLDMLLFAIVGVIVSVRIKKYYKAYEQILKANITLNKKTPSIHEDVFEGQKIISLKNPLHHSAALTGIVLSATKILTRIRFDIAHGAPSGAADAIWMIAYYISDLLIAVLVYATSLLVFSYLERKTKDAPADHKYHI